MSGIIEIDDMPNLGVVTPTTQFVGEKAGSGLFSAAAIRDYIYQGGVFTGGIRAPTVIYVQAAGSGNAQFSLQGPDPAAEEKGGLIWYQASNFVSVFNTATDPPSALQLTALGDFLFQGTGVAYKAGGGSWAAVSDARIKTVESDYTPGLTELLQLRPVTYRYRPNCGIAATATSYVGLIAQEVAPVLPDMVHTTNGIIDGQPVSDLLSLDVNELQYVLLNAIKELSARVEALEAAAA